MTTLTKQIDTTFVAGTPGTPGTPEYTSYEPHTLYGTPPYFNGVIWVYDFWAWSEWQPVQGSSVWARMPPYTVLVPTYHPAVAGTPGTPSQTLVDYHLGWTGRAESIASLAANGYFSFKLPVTDAGAVVGMSTAPQTVGYSDIKYGFNSVRGVAKVYENGVDVFSYGAHTAANVFKIRRRAGIVEYLVDATVVYTSTQPADNSMMYLTAALYSGGDSVIDAAVGGEGAGAGSMMPLSARSWYTGYELGTAEAVMLPMQSTAYCNSSSAFTALKPLESSGGIAYAQALASMLPITSFATGFPPGAYSLGVNAIGALISSGHGLTGEIGTSTGNTMMPLTAIGGRPYAQAYSTMSPMTSFGFTYEGPNDATVFSGAITANVLSPDVTVFVIMNSQGTVTALLTAQLLVDGLVNSVALMSGTATPQLTIGAVMTALASARNLNFDDGQSTVWVLNTKNDGTTRYENFGFNSFAKIGANYYGVKTDGLYRLEGATDAGAQIPAAVNLGKSDFGTSLQKSLDQCYVGVASNGAVVLKVVADGQTYLYTARSSSANLDTQRIDLGRGFKANFYELELQNSTGGAFELATVEFTPVPLSRRI
jgi:hypothetical protein